MIRFGLGVLVATTACAAALGIAACGDTIKDAGTGPGAGGSSAGGGSATGGSGASSGSTNGGASGGGSLTFPTACTGTCCPTDQTCYAGPSNGKDVGGECMATHVNNLDTDDHIQMRQAWIKATTPVGNTDATVYKVLAGRTQLPLPNCYQQGAIGSGGYIQIIDFYLGGSKKTPGDISKDYSTVGYSTYVTDANVQDTLTKGFCNGVDDDYGPQIKPGYALTTAQVTTPETADFPPGLPKPMGAGDTPSQWKVGPTKAKRIAGPDFDLSDPAKRKELLKMFDLANPDNIAKDGYGGVFFYDDATGYAHGYGSLGWTVVYAADGKSHLSIPIREVETKSRFNDPKHPNCVGQFLADKLDPGSTSPGKCATLDPDAPAWGGGNCKDHTCAPGSEAPATTEGYFLITELEQLFSPDLGKTLCVSYAGVDPADPQKTRNLVDAQGFYDASKKSCRSAKWDPTAAGNAGLPSGDWCAATNSKATPTCHDAWHSKSLHVFIGGKIQVPADASQPLTTCKFQP